VRVKLDENLPDSVITILGRVGHDVETARAEGLRGADDPAALAGATADGRLLLTLDRGLGDIRSYPPGTHAGVLVIRLDHNPHVPSEMPSNASAPHSISTTSKDASRCGATANSASGGPNLDERADVLNGLAGEIGCESVALWPSRCERPRLCTLLSSVHRK
jgi:predicted nuclease of predicted toxin-antitoxin system